MPLVHVSSIENGGEGGGAYQHILGSKNCTYKSMKFACFIVYLLLKSQPFVSTTAKLIKFF